MQEAPSARPFTTPIFPCFVLFCFVLFARPSISWVGSVYQLQGMRDDMLTYSRLPLWRRSYAWIMVLSYTVVIISVAATMRTDTYIKAKYLNDDGDLEVLGRELSAWNAWQLVRLVFAVAGFGVGAMLLAGNQAYASRGRAALSGHHHLAAV